MSVIVVQSLSSEEQEQLAQTIEMFEVIVQASPQDTQSMEILKDAYLRLGRQSEALGISKRLAATFVELGQYSQAMIEYENILQQDPTNAEVIAALGEMEDRLHKAAKPPEGAGLKPPASPLAASTLNINMGVTDGGTLMTTEQTLQPEGRRGGERLTSIPDFQNDGNELLARFLIQHKLAPEEMVTSLLERVQKKNDTRGPGQLATSLIDEICRRGNIEQDLLFSGILDRSKFAYIPLEYYDVDRSVIKMLPEELTMGRLIVPFDVMSRTLMVALANPFDAAGKDAVQQLLDYNVQWHLASPQAISKVLSEAYRISAGSESGLRLAS